MIGRVQGLRTRYRLYRMLHCDEISAIGYALRLPGRRYWEFAVGLMIAPMVWALLALLALL